jgi:nitrogen fixation NifU-like protein
LSKAKLYDDLLMEHIKHARNYRVIENADRTADGSNPLCGDNMTLFLRMDSGRILDAAFQCTCCGVSMASASIMTEQVQGRTIAEVRAMGRAFRNMLEHAAESPLPGDMPGAEAMLETAREYPARARCAALPWTTLETMLADLSGD